MKELKFRIWDKDERVMRYLNNFFCDQYQIGFSNDHYVDLSENESEIVEIMQYTGLKDKRGGEIYEGDIYKYKEGGRNFLVSNELMWNCGCCSDIYGWNLSHPEQIEVVGNIYENPELLNESN